MDTTDQNNQNVESSRLFINNFTWVSQSTGRFRKTDNVSEYAEPLLKWNAFTFRQLRVSKFKIPYRYFHILDFLNFNILNMKEYPLYFTIQDHSHLQVDLTHDKTVCRKKDFEIFPLFGNL